jgi:hypothetical protein
MAIFNSYVKLPEGTNAVPINQGGIGSPGTGEVPPGGMAMENLWLWGDRKLGTQWGQQENMGTLEHELYILYIYTRKYD